MKICDGHFQCLQDKIKSRGIWDFVRLPAKNEVVPFRDAKQNVDPLMFALSMVYGECIRAVLLQGDPGDLFRADENVTPHLACPICHLNWLSEQHEAVCTNPECPKGMRWECILETAAKCAQTLIEVMRRK